MKKFYFLCKSYYWPKIIIFYAAAFIYRVIQTIGAYLKDKIHFPYRYFEIMGTDILKIIVFG